MRKIHLFLLGIFMVFSFTVPAYAVNIFPGCSSGTLSTTTVCKDVTTEQQSNSNEVLVVLKDVINVMSYIVGIAAVILIIVGGLRMVLSGGESKTVQEARSTIFTALIGVFIVAVAQIIVVFVLNRIK